MEIIKSQQCWGQKCMKARLIKNKTRKCPVYLPNSGGVWGLLISLRYFFSKANIRKALTLCQSPNLVALNPINLFPKLSPSARECAPIRRTSPSARTPRPNPCLLLIAVTHRRDTAPSGGEPNPQADIISHSTTAERDEVLMYFLHVKPPHPQWVR